MDSIAALSNKGRRRRKNEDSILNVPLRGGAMLLAVADGVGGERAGEVASAGVTKLISEQLTTQDLQRYDEDLSMAVQAANHALWERSRNDARLQGMATTLVAAIVSDGSAWLANVGDSRAYLIEGDTITQITQDHSLVAERVREGDITEEEARQSHARHIITRSIASEAAIEVDTFGPVALPPDSRLLLCSDGLHDVVEAHDIARITSGAPAEEAARQLIDAANNLGGPDNISVVIYQAPGASAGTPRRGRKRAGAIEPPNRYALAGITAGIVLIIGAAALGAGIFVGESSNDDTPAIADVPDDAETATPLAQLSMASPTPVASNSSATRAALLAVRVTEAAATRTALALAPTPCGGRQGVTPEPSLDPAGSPTPCADQATPEGDSE